MLYRPDLFQIELSDRIRSALSSDSVGQTAVFFESRAEKNKQKNLYRFLLTESGKRLFSLAGNGTHFLSEDNSDFENFTEMLYLLPMLSMSGYYDFFRATIEYFCGFKKNPTPIDADAMWINSLPVLQAYDSDMLSEGFRVLSVLNGTRWINPSTDRMRSFDTLDTYGSAYANEIKAHAAVHITLSDLRFCSPDPYHAKKGFSAISEGKATEEDSVYFSSQLWRITGEVCKQNEIPLILSGNPSVPQMRSLSEYLRKNNRLPQLLYALPICDGREAVQALEEAEECGLLEEASCIILTNVSEGSNAALQNALYAVASRYPIGKLLFAAEGESSLQIRLEHERFTRLLSSVLAESVSWGDLSGEDSAVSLGKRILFDNAAEIFRY